MQVTEVIDMSRTVVFYPPNKRHMTFLCQYIDIQEAPKTILAGHGILTHCSILMPWHLFCNINMMIAVDVTSVQIFPRVMFGTIPFQPLNSDNSYIKQTK